MKRNSKTLRLTSAAMLLAFSIILPMIFHLTGIPQAGAVFLPMHIPVLMTGFILGPVWGTVIGVLSPVISFLLTNMPGAERLPFMVAELAGYGFASGLLFHTFKLKNKKFGIVVTLIAAMTAGRLIYALVLFAAARFFSADCVGAIGAFNAAVKGIYGIILQLVTIPPVVYALKKGDFIR